MKTRIAIPVENQDGLEAPIAEHFGRAPFFAIVDLDEKGKVASVKTEANTRRTSRRHRASTRKLVGF